MIVLGKGRLRAELHPRLGGCVSRLIWRGERGPVDLLRPATSAFRAAGDPTGAACFVTSPYFGPVVGGVFRFDGEKHVLHRNHVAEPEPIQGEAWLGPWTVVAKDEAAAHLRHVHKPRPGRFPFACATEMRVALTLKSVLFDLAVENLDTRPAPAGLGLHPYFPKTDETRLRLRAAALWSRDPLKGPAPLEPLPERFRFDAERPLGDLEADDCMEGWDGEARIASDGDGPPLLLRADPVFGKLQLFAPPAEDYVCVEPVTNAPDGFRLSAAGIENSGVRRLAPGARLSGRVRIELDGHG